MSVTIDVERATVEAAGRLAVYSTLAMGLMFPTESRVGALRSVLLPGLGMLDLGPELNGLVEALPHSLPEDLGGLRGSYMEIFPPIASQDAPGYETGYRGDGVFQQSALMADVAGFYRAHGLKAGGEERERPDHITVELEFMATVAKKEALALQAGEVESASICRETAAGFLADHLGCWGPAFGRRVSAVTTSAWYSNLGELLARWVEADVARMGVTPADVADSPLPQEPPDDGSCGPCPVPGLGAAG